MDQTKILIIGSKGMLGHALKEVFPLAVGYDINSINKVDITDEHSVKKVFAKEAPKFVINAAAYTNVDGAETDFETALKVNAIGVNNLLCECIHQDAVFVQLSTDYVFNGQNGQGYDESFSDYAPLNKYGKSKMLAEIVIKTFGYPKVYLLRTAWLYGPDGKNFIDTILRLAKERPELKVVNDQFGCPTYTRDLAQFIKEILNYPFGIYHAVNEGTASWFDLASEAIRLKGLPAKIIPCATEEYPLPAKRPKYSILLKTKDQPLMRLWKEALADYLSA